MTANNSGCTCISSAICWFWKTVKMILGQFTRMPQITEYPKNSKQYSKSKQKTPKKHITLWTSVEFYYVWQFTTSGANAMQNVDCDSCPTLGAIYLCNVQKIVIVRYRIPYIELLSNSTKSTNISNKFSGSFRL